MRRTYFTNATPGNQKPRSTVNHFGGSLGGPIRCAISCFSFSTANGCGSALPIVSTAVTVPTARSRSYVLQQLPAWAAGLGDRRDVSGGAAAGAVLQKLFSLYGFNTSGTPLAVLGCPFNTGGGAATGSPPNGNGCANRQSVSHSSDDHEQVQTGAHRLTTSMKRIRHGSASRPTRACRPPIPIRSIPLFDAISPQPLYSVAAGYTHIFFAASGELFQSGVLLV
jgi:hypothetical protein